MQHMNEIYNHNYLHNRKDRYDYTPKISAFIVAKNEQKNIARAIDSISWVNDIVVIVDNTSIDATDTLAKSMGARVVYSNYDGMDKEKNKAMRLCKNDWIIELDADEELERGAQEVILDSIRYGTAVAYSLIREDGMWGLSFIKSNKVRIYHKEHVCYNGYTHEQLVIDGAVKSLDCGIYHYNAQTVAEWWARSLVLADEYVTMTIKQKKDFNLLQIFLNMIYQGLGWFFFTYFVQGLIFKGFPGFIYSVLSSIHSISRWVIYYERKYVVGI